MAGFFKTSVDRPRETTPDGELAPAVGPADGSKGIAAVEATFKPGGAHPFHTHPGQEEVIWVLEGVIEQWIEQEKTTLGVGDVAVIPEGVVHATYNDGQATARILAILSPCVGESGYGAVDVSGEEPWASLRRA
jgi:quercetin dioxygenase-like cupin family protein